MAVVERDPLNEMAQVGVVALRRMGSEMPIVAGARHAAQSAQPFHAGVVLANALRLGGDHRLDDRVEVGAPLSRLVASQSRKASRKKCRSACCWPTRRSSSAMRALACASRSAGLAADRPAPEGGGSSDGKPAGAAPPSHPARRPRRRLSPAILLRVGCFRSFKASGPLRREAPLARLHAFVAHRLVFGG